MTAQLCEHTKLSNCTLYYFKKIFLNCTLQTGEFMVCELYLNKAVFFSKRTLKKERKKHREVGNQPIAGIISAEAIWSQDDIST